VLEQPRTDLGAHVVEVPLPHLLVVPLGALDEVGPLDHGEEVVPLLHGDGRQADETVSARLDTRDHGEHPGATRPAWQCGEQRRVAHQAHRETFERGDVDVFPLARSTGRGTAGERPGRGERPDRPFAELSPHRQR
jgi:hypothetical protein